MTSNEEELYKKAAEHFGVINQLNVAIEELSELQKEICKTLRGCGDLNHLAEETADALIMIDQLRLLLDIDIDVDLWKSHKLDRLEHRINIGEKT